MTHTSLLLNVAHRGARALAPENTIPAIRMARRTGANAVELDVQMTHDGELVVFHDDDLIRCSDAVDKYPLHADYTLGAFTLEELLVLDVGPWYVNELARAPLHRQRYLRDLTAEEVERWITPADADEYQSGSVGIPPVTEALAVAHECEMIVLQWRALLLRRGFRRAELAQLVQKRPGRRRYPWSGAQFRSDWRNRDAIHVQRREPRVIEPRKGTGVLEGMPRLF